MTAREAHGANLAGQVLLSAAPEGEIFPPSTGGLGDISPLLAGEIRALMNRGLTTARAIQAVQVQSRVAAADLARQLQTAMGTEYAGLWFTNASARLNVGVASPTGRRAAEQTVANAGLTGIVTYTPVRSTMAELHAVQQQWNKKLATLPTPEDIATAIQPQHNRVVVTIDESMSARRRTALKREAAASQVNVGIVVTPGRGARTTLHAKECDNYPPANCNPSITAGVAIERSKENTGEGKGKSHKNTTLDGFAEMTLKDVLVGDRVAGPGIPANTIVTALPTKTSVTISNAATTEEEAEFTFSTGAECSAGPAAIPKNNKAQRVLLTAGHCIESGHGVGAKWFAFNRTPAKVQIGTAIAYKNGGAVGAGIGDYGDITIEEAWQTGVANDPVLAVTARWEKNEETRYPIVGERVPAIAEAVNYHEGQGSGGTFGVIEALNVSTTVNGKTKEGLVEDTAAAAGGDSGGDWFFVNTTGKIEAEGTLVGVKGSTGNSVYEPLTKPEAGSPEGSLEALNLELLTTENEKIPPC